MADSNRANRPEPDSVRLYSSRRSWAFALLGSLLLIAGPLAVAVSRPLGAPGIAALVVGVIATIALLFDQPTVSIVRADGIERRCPLSKRHLGWEQIESLDRLRRSGGVVAKVGRRRMVLCDRREGHLEHLQLIELVETNGPEVIVRLPEPDIDSRPTNIYRRKDR